MRERGAFLHAAAERDDADDAEESDSLGLEAEAVMAQIGTGRGRGRGGDVRRRPARRVLVDLSRSEGAHCSARKNKLRSAAWPKPGRADRVDGMGLGLFSNCRQLYSYLSSKNKR